MLFTINRVESYTFEEFKEIQKNNRIEDTNEKRLIVYIALMMHIDSIAYANGIESGLSSAFNQIISLLMIVAKYGALSLGLKEAITVMLNGGSFKDSMTGSVQYLLGYVYIQLLPSLFSMFSGLKF